MNNRRHSKHGFQVFFNRLVKKLKNNRILTQIDKRYVKKYLFVALSAIFIGLLFGVVTLNLLNHLGQPQDVDAVIKNQSFTDENNEASTNENDRLRAFVVQGGVFSDQANLREWKKQFKDKGFQTVVWKRDDLYYLFLGLATNEEMLDLLNEHLKEAGFDVYIRIWETAELNDQLGKNDLIWLTSFYHLWNESIRKTSDEKQFLNKWLQLMEDEVAVSEKVSLFVDEMTALFNEQSFETENERQVWLLKLWLLYEEYFLMETDDNEN